MDNELPIAVASSTENVLPKFTRERTERAEPSEAKLITLTAEPHLAKLRIDRVEPTDALSMTESWSAEPHCRSPITDKPDPILR
jgi:hypothetical protein